MAKHQTTSFNFRSSCSILVFLSIFSSIPLLYWSYSIGYGYCHNQVENNKEMLSMEPINLLKFPKAWNQLVFSSKQQRRTPQTRLLKIGLFVRKWPEKNQAGGMERHALTLYLALAKRGHDLHIFTTSSSANIPSIMSNLHFHISRPIGSGYLNQVVAWKQFLEENATKAFDVIHSESVGLRLTKSSSYLNNVAVSWHGIAYETIHSDIIQELVRNPLDSSSQQVISDGKMMKVVEEVKFFQYYAHHVATSDHVGDVLKRIYMIPEERVHIILNGVDEEIFKPDVSKGNDFLLKLGINQDRSGSSIILGLSGRLVKDKGHPLMFEALQQIFLENSTFKDSVIVLIAGNGPWGDRYKELGPNVMVLGPLERAQLAEFYNAIDIFVHPTLRAQGLDQVPLEAFLTGKPVVATKLASFTGSIIVNEDMGYTFSPTVSELKKVLYEVWEGGKKNLEKKGGFARERGLKMFTATKMVAAYERLFLCISGNNEEKQQKSEDYCVYQPHQEMD
ncbi:D-inositol 3-phosphate glycosyltransferase 1-like [Solanum tuberosum]|nr:PREDICTED: D-inositol 3-phosphate glycosyltransferase 1-like [Solanum tuberosum]